MQIRRVQVEGPDRVVTLSYTEWGAPGSTGTVLCVHGLTRNARDFDHLARALAVEMRVICPDMVGRGRSDRLADPERYVLPTYINHMIQFIEQMGFDKVDWVGTSMGGMIGMAVAAAEPGKIRRLVLNDVGPHIPKAALGRIRSYLGLDLSFASFEELEAHLRFIHAGFGPLSDAEWRHLAEHSALSAKDGSWWLSYDPQLRVPFQQSADEDIDLWPVWDEIRCPVLVLRGSGSDLLLPETAAEMARRGPRATVVDIEGTGHAPALMAKDQIEIVRAWLKTA